MFRVQNAAVWGFAIPIAIMLAVRLEEGLDTSASCVQDQKEQGVLENLLSAESDSVDQKEQGVLENLLSAESDSVDQKEQGILENLLAEESDSVDGLDTGAASAEETETPRNRSSSSERSQSGGSSSKRGRSSSNNQEEKTSTEGGASNRGRSRTRDEKEKDTGKPEDGTGSSKRGRSQSKSKEDGESKEKTQEGPVEGEDGYGVAATMYDVAWYPVTFWKDTFGSIYGNEPAEPAEPAEAVEQPNPYIGDFLTKAYMSTCGCMHEFVGYVGRYKNVGYKNVDAVDNWMARQKFIMRFRDELVQGETSKTLLEENVDKCDALGPIIDSIDDAMREPLQTLSECCTALYLGDTANDLLTPVSPLGHMHDVMLVSKDLQLVIRIFEAGMFRSTFQIFEVLHEKIFKDKEKNKTRSMESVWLHILFHVIPNMYNTEPAVIAADSKKELDAIDKLPFNLLMTGQAIVDISLEGEVALKLTNEYLNGIMFNILPTGKSGKHESSFYIASVIKEPSVGRCANKKDDDKDMCALFANRSSADGWRLTERPKFEGRERYYGKSASSCRTVAETIKQLNEQNSTPDMRPDMQNFLLGLQKQVAEKQPERGPRSHSAPPDVSRNSNGSDPRPRRARSRNPRGSSFIALETTRCSGLLECIFEVISDFFSSLFGPVSHSRQIFNNYLPSSLARNGVSGMFSQCGHAWSQMWNGFSQDAAMQWFKSVPFCNCNTEFWTRRFQEFKQTSDYVQKVFNEKAQAFGTYLDGIQRQSWYKQHVVPAQNQLNGYYAQAKKSMTQVFDYIGDQRAPLLNYAKTWYEKGMQEFQRSFGPAMQTFAPRAQQIGQYAQESLRATYYGVANQFQVDPRNIEGAADRARQFAQYAWHNPGEATHQAMQFVDAHAHQVRAEVQNLMQRGYREQDAKWMVLNRHGQAPGLFY